MPHSCSVAGTHRGETILQRLIPGNDHESNESLVAAADIDPIQIGLHSGRLDNPLIVVRSRIALGMVGSGLGIRSLWLLLDVSFGYFISFTAVIAY